MRRDDYILALTAGFLTADKAAFDTALTYFSQFYELDQPAKPNIVSIGAANENQEPASYLAWLKDLRSAGVQEVYFYWQAEQPHPSMPAHVAAAFAGSPSLHMQVTTGESVTTWRLRTLLSPQYEMKAEQFTDLINAQSQKEVLWKRIEEMVNESNRLNDRPMVEANRIQQYLHKEGHTEYSFLVSQLITEVQVECEVLETPFIIPEGFQTLLYQSNLDSFYGSASDREPVFLYPTGPVTKEDLLKLVNAQLFAREVWEELEKGLAEYPLTNIPTTGYPAALDTLDEAAAQELGHNICRAIAIRCEQHNAQPIIPADLLHCIGPDELDGKRARARGRLSGGKQWYLQSIQHPWELYLFTSVAAAAITDKETSDEVRSHFISTLKQIAALATRMQTPYVEAFQSAAFLLNDKLPAGQFNEAHENAIVEAMQQQGFSEQATHIFRSHFSYAKDLHLLQLSPENITGLCAISMADVFGGMGSWNDLDPGEEGLEYQRLSADLFETKQRYFATLLGAEPK